MTIKTKHLDFVTILALESSCDDTSAAILRGRAISDVAFRISEETADIPNPTSEILRGWQTYIPSFQYRTDNAGMIATAAFFKYLKSDFVGQDIAPLPRMAL